MKTKLHVCLFLLLFTREAYAQMASVDVHCTSDLGEFYASEPLYRIGETSSFESIDGAPILLGTLQKRYSFYGRFTFVATGRTSVGISTASISVADAANPSTFGRPGGGVGSARMPNGLHALSVARGQRFSIYLQGSHTDAISCRVLPKLPIR